MFIATKANARTAVKANDEGMSGALRVAFSGGAVLGLAVVGFGLLGLAGIAFVVYAITKDIHSPIQILTGYSLGCSLIALGRGADPQDQDTPVRQVRRVAPRPPDHLRVRPRKQRSGRLHAPG